MPLDRIPKENLRAKRLLDLAIGIPALTASTPLLAATWLGHKIAGLLWPEDRGPAFFRVFRHAGGRAILLHKVRLSTLTMLQQLRAELDTERVNYLLRHVDEADRQRVKRRLDLLVEDLGQKKTRFGQLLKLVYLDELPQILNVVAGDMSLVGPRPLPLHDARTRPDADGMVELGGERFDYRHRDMLPGGLTGLYQTNKSAAAKQDYQQFVKEGVALDRQYYEFLRSAGPLEVIVEDLKIIVATIKIVAEHQGV